tara:strand:- start:19 stop:312 length:294 start_codon:yes stop_codon:yes gene_type:complete
MNKSDLKQLIKEEITNILNENEGYSYPYFEIEINDYREISTASGVYHEMKNSFQDKTEQSEGGGIFTFQNEDDWDNFYKALEDAGVPEKAIIGIDNN